MTLSPLGKSLHFLVPPVLILCDKGKMLVTSLCTGMLWKVINQCMPIEDLLWSKSYVKSVNWGYCHSDVSDCTCSASLDYIYIGRRDVFLC